MYEKLIRSTRQQKALEYAIKRIKESPLCPYIREMYLFGSCAREQENYKSDVDLFVELAADFPKDDESLRRSMRWLQSDVTMDGMFDPEVDMKIAIGDEWKQSDMLFYKNVRRDGKLICL